MAKGFNLTAQINLRGPANLKPVIAQIRKELGTVSADVKLNIDARSIKSVDAITSKLRAMNSVLVQSKQNVDSLNSSFRTLSSALSTSQSDTNKATSSINRTAESASSAAKTVKQAGTAMEEFGKQSFLAIKRFAAFSFVTTGIFALTNAITGGFRAFINFDKELVKLQQVTGKGASGIAALEKEITRLATSMGVSSESLINVASTLAQAGLSADETRIALEALAKTELAPSFDNLTDTTEGAIAAMRQFGLEAGQLESALGSVNAVAAAYAVESKDIISAIQRTGGVFATASKGVSEGTDALNEFVAIFTSVRQTTRESAETIATGLRTIFTRIQRASTIQQLKEFGVVLTDLEGKFVGPFEAIKRLSEGLSRLDPRDLRFSQIVEELGGFRQIGKVIPLIQQFAVAQEALKVAQKGQGSLTEAQVVAQQSLANQLAKVREQFLALIRDVGKSTVFQGLFKVVTGLASGLISLAGAFKPILPILAVMGAIKGVSAVTQFATGFFGGIGKGGGARSVGQNAGETISGAKEKEKAEATNRASQAISENTGAIRTLTTAINNLTTRVDANTSAINSRGASTLSGGGKVLGFNKGGIVPGSGKGDKIPALLEPGEVVINNTAANKYGRGNLVRMNKYYSGGNITNQTEVGGVPATTKVIKGKNKEIVGFDKDTYRINVDKKTLPIIYNKKDKNFRANRKVIPQESINKLIKNDPTSFEIWEDIVAQSFGASRANTNDPNYPVDIVKGNKLYDAKFRPDSQFKERDAVVKALSYRLENTNSGYKYNQSNKTIRLSKFLGTNITSGSDNFTDKGSISFVYPEFKDFPVDLEEIQTQLNIRKAQYQKFGEQGAGYFAKKAIEAIDNKKYISGNKDIINLISIPKKKKHTGGLIQKFAKGSKVGLGSLSTNDQGVAIRRVGIIDTDALRKKANAERVAEGMKLLGATSEADYGIKLSRLAGEARKSDSLKRFRVMAGAAANRKSSIATGRGVNDDAMLRKTTRKHILHPDDLKEVDEIISLTTTLKESKLDYMNMSDRIYSKDSSREDEQALVKFFEQQRNINRDYTLFDREPGTTTGLSPDYGLQTASLISQFGTTENRTNKGKVITLGEKINDDGSPMYRIRRKRENELPELVSAKGQFPGAARFPTRGHIETAIATLLEKTKERYPEATYKDLLVALAPDLSLDGGSQGREHGARYGVVPASFARELIRLALPDIMISSANSPSQTGINSRIAEIERGSTGRRRFAVMEKDAPVVISKAEHENPEAIMERYKLAGLTPYNIARSSDQAGDLISGTEARKAAINKDYAKLDLAVLPQIGSAIKANQPQLRNRSMMVPLVQKALDIFVQGNADKVNEQVDEILKNASGGPFTRMTPKFKQTHPDLVKQIQQLRRNRNAFQRDTFIDPAHELLRIITDKNPDIYGLDVKRQTPIDIPVSEDQIKQHIVDASKLSSYFRPGLSFDSSPAQLSPTLAAIQSTVPTKAQVSSKSEEGLPPAAKVLQALGIPNIKTSKKNSDAEIYIRGSRKDAKLNPEDLKRYQEIKSRYLSLVGAREEAEKEDIKKTKAKGLLFGAAGMYGSPFPPIKKQISSPELSGPVDVRITSGVMNAGTAKQIEQDFIRSEKKVVNRASKKLMIDNILTDAGLNKTINLDFDRTLAFGADKIATGSGSAKFAGFADRSIVQQTLGRARMSRLGMSLAQLVQTNPDLLQNLRVVTARPQNTLDLVQSWLSSKGLPIPLSQFTGVGGPSIREEDIPSLKAALLAPGSVFVDDDRKNIREARRYSQQNRAKIKTYRYGLDSVKQDANAEGTIRGIQFERIIESLGGPKADRSSKGIDFPKGLRAAAKYFGISSNIPTDAKRTLSGPSTVEDNIISYLKDNGYAALNENKVQAFMAGGKADARPFGTGSFKFPRRISNSYFKDFDEREARSKADEVWGGALDKRVPIDIDKVSEEFDKKPLDRTRFLSSFNRKIQTNELYQNLAQFAKFIGLPKEDLSVAIPQNVDFTPKLGQAISSAIGQFDRTGMGGRGMEKNTELAMEAAGFSAGQEQDLYGYNKLLEDKKKELIKITKTPVRTFDDGSFSYDQDAFRKVSAEIDAIRNNISELGKQKSNAQTKAADMIQKQAAQTGRGTVSLATKHFSSNGAQGSVFYHELTHQLFQGLRTKSAESFQKYKERVNQLFSTDNDQLADAFDSLNSGYNSADVVYGYRYKTNTLSQIISNNNKEKIKTPAVDSALDMWARSSNIKKARDFRPLNEPFNKILLNNSIKQSFIDRMEDSGKEEFLTTLVENAGKLDGMLQSVLDSTLDELLGGAGITRQRYAGGGFVKDALKNSRKTITWGKGGPNEFTTNEVDSRAARLSTQKPVTDAIEQQLSALGISSLRFIGSGKDSLAYESDKNNIVKFTPAGLKKYSTNIPEQLKPTFAKLIEGYGVEVMPKVDTNVSDTDLETLKKLIRSKGYEWGDAAKDNMGKLGDRLVVIDGDLSPLRMPSPPLPTAKFARGGTIPARVSNGEAFVPPKLARRIGYSKLDKLNKADRNGMSFSGGGISVFKGPGSGTSDSISTSLPVGGYVIREKATKALGLYKNGGSVGVRRFVDGGEIDIGEQGRKLQEQKFRLTSKQARKAQLEKKISSGVSSGDLKGPELQQTLDEFDSLDKEIGTLIEEIGTIEKEFAALSEAIEANIEALLEAALQTNAATEESVSAADQQEAAKQAVVAALKERVSNWDSLDDKTKASAIDQVSRNGRLNDKTGKEQVFDKEFEQVQAADVRAYEAKNSLVEARAKEKDVATRNIDIIAEKKSKFGDIVSIEDDKTKELNNDIDRLPASNFVSQKQVQLEEEKKRKESLQTKASTATGGEKAILNDQIRASDARIAELNEAIDGAKQAYINASRAVEEQEKIVDKASEETKQAEKDLDAAYQGIVNALRSKIKNFDQFSPEEQAAAVEQVAKTGKVVSKSGKPIGGDRLEAARAEYAAAEQQAKVEMPTREADARKALDEAKARKERLNPTPTPTSNSEFDFTNSDAAKQSFADKEFIKYRAAQTDSSESGVKLDLAQRLGKATYESQQLFGGKVSEAKTGLVTRRESAMKIGGSIQAAKEAVIAAKDSGDEDALKVANQQLADANSRLSQETEGILQQMIELRPDIAATKEGMDQLAKQSQEVAQELSTGDLAKAQEKFGTAVAGKGAGGTLSKDEAAAVAVTRVSKETGADAGFLDRQFGPRGVNAKMVKQQTFIQSREGQRFGALASLAPGRVEAFSKSKLGGALGKGADFVSGKGGALSKAFAGAGGFTGIGMGLATGAETLKQFLPKTMTSDPNTAGALGALGGAGTGAAAGAQLGSLAGPVGALIGGVGGAIIGGIQGFFNAKNQAILTNALENIAKKSGDLEIAFKKLETNFTKANFENAQKQFGEVLNAQKDVRDMAFSSPSITGNDAMSIGGMTLAGAGTGAAVGALAGKWIGGLLGGAAGTAAAPGAGTAAGAVGGSLAGAGIGATIGAGIGGLAGAAYGFFNRPSAEQRKEALGATIQQAGIQNDTAIRLAESQLKTMSAEDIDKTFKDSNPIVEQYKKGMKGATAAQAEEAAALDAFMKLRKQSGATDEQIRKEIESGRSAAIAKGKEYNNAQAEALKKQALLAIATKQVALATESLLDVYRRVTANAQRFSDEVGDMLSGAQASISSLGGKAEVPKVDRRGSERVLGNISAYSSDEVKVATQDVVSKLGGGEEAQKLGKQAEAAKFLQDKLPAMLRAPDADKNQIIDSIRTQFKGMGLDSNAINAMIQDIETEIAKNQDGNLGTLASDIEKGGIGSISSTSQEALKTLQNLSKTYNDTLQESINLQNQYNEVIMQSEEYMRKAGTIRISAELDLAKALGNSPTLAQLNEPFNFEVRDLTKGLIPGGTTDPAQIAAGIVSATKENEILKDKNTQLNSTPTGADGQAAANALKEQQKNNAAMSANSKAINQGRQALEKLANDGTKAANALAKIEENERIYEGGRSLGRTVLTSDSQQLYEMNKSLAAYTKTISGRANAKDANSLQFRKDAFAGFDIVKNLMPQSMSKQIEARLQKEMIEAMPEGQQMLDQQVGIGNNDEKITLRDVLDRAISGKANEEDPNVKAYREAVDTQIKANEQLSMLNELQALKIQESMIGLQEFLANKFPEILTKAVTASREDAATKPEVSSGDAKTESGKKRQQTEQEIVSKQEEKTKLDKEIANIDTQLEKEKKKKWIDQDPAKIAKLENQKRSAENKRKDVEFGIKNRQARLEEEKAAEKQELAQVKQEEETKKKEKEATKPVVVSAERAAKQQEIADKEKQIQENKDKQASEAQAATQTQTSTYTVSRPATSTAAASASQQVYGSTRTAAAKGKPEASKPVARTEPTVKELENKLKGLRSQGKKGRDSSEYSQTVFMLDRKKNEEKIIKDKVKQDKLASNKTRALGAALPEYAKMVKAGTMSQADFDTKKAEYDTLKEQQKAKSYTSKPSKPLNEKQQAYIDAKKQKREAYLSRFRPEVREKMMTKKEKAERDAQVAQAEEAKRQAEVQAQEQQATSPQVSSNQKPVELPADVNLEADRKAFEEERKAHEDKVSDAKNTLYDAKHEAQNAQIELNDARESQSNQDQSLWYYEPEYDAEGKATYDEAGNRKWKSKAKPGESVEQMHARVKKEKEEETARRAERVRAAEERKAEADRKLAEAQTNYTQVETDQAQWTQDNSGRQESLRQREEAERKRQQLEEDRKLVATGQFSMTDRYFGAHRAMYGDLRYSDKYQKEDKDLKEKIARGETLTPEEQAKHDTYRRKEKEYYDNRRAQAQANVEAHGGLPAGYAPQQTNRPGVPGSVAGGVPPVAAATGPRYMPQQDPNDQRLPPQPVPSNRPASMTPSSSNPTTASASGASVPAQLLTLDPASLDGLNTFNSNFASYVDKLIGFQFPTIPDKIELVGSYDLNVQITGAAALEGLDKRMKELAISLVEPKLEQLRNEVSAATQGAVKPSAAKGKK